MKTVIIIAIAIPIIAVIVGIFVMPVLEVTFGISNILVDVDSTLSKFKNIGYTTIREGGDVEKALDEFMETSEYKNACRSLYQDWLELRKAPHYGDPPKFVNQMSELFCLESMEKWN